MIKIGYDTEAEELFYADVTHTLFTGITRHGKSEAMKALATEAEEEGYSILLFDVKSKRDYEDIGQEIPVYMKESTDPMTLKGLLEADADLSLNFQLSEIIQVCERGDDYEEVLEEVNRMMDDEDTHPVTVNKLRVIRYLLQEMIEDMETVEISDSLELQDGINVMDLSDVADSVKQVAIAASVDEILDNHEKVIVGVDEAHNFIPQQGKPPANEPIVDIIREGAASDIWVWLSDQTLTGVDKEPLKQVKMWLLGSQREKNEAKHVIEQIPGRSKYSKNDVMTLEKGHFIVTVDDRSTMVYIQPVWMDDETALDIVGGEIDMTEATKPDEDELEELEDALAEANSTISDLRQKLESRDKRIEDLESTIDKLNRQMEEEDEPEVARRGETFIPDEEAVKRIVDDYLEGQDLDVGEEIIAEIVDEKIREFVDEVEAPGEVAVDVTKSTIVVRRVVEPIEVSVDDRLGKVAWLYAEGEFDQLDEWFTTADVEELVHSHGWSETIKRTNVLSEMTKMGFFEQKKYADRTRGYRVVMPPDEAKERGLLKVEEEITA